MGSISPQPSPSTTTPTTPQYPESWYAQANAVCHFTNITEIGILKTFIDFRVFDHIPLSGSISIPSLASLISAQPSIIERFSSMLVLKNILAAPEPGFLAHTVVSKGYRTGEVAAGLINYIYDFYLFPIAHWPQYFAQNGLREPEVNVTPLGLALGVPDKDFYEVLKTDPKKEVKFNRFMSSISSQVSLKGIYDFGWLKEKIEQKDGRLLIVDIGGGKGQGLKGIFADYAWLEGEMERCVLVDREVVVEENKAEEDEVLRRVQLVPGDMFRECPVKNAHIYHISRVLNDWPDSHVIQALQHVRAACAPDSRLLIVEELLLENPSGLNLAQDIFLLNTGGKRRNEKMFRELGAESGWEVKKTYVTEKVGVVEMVPV